MISRSHTGSPIHCQAFLRILNAGALPPSVVTMIHLIEQHLSVFASVLQQTPSFLRLFASLVNRWFCTRAHDRLVPNGEEEAWTIAFACLP